VSRERPEPGDIVVTPVSGDREESLMSTTTGSGERTDEDSAGDAAGPIEYLVIEFPEGYRTGENLPLLVDLVDRGLIRLLDLAFVRRETDGSVTMLELTDLDGDGQLDLAVFHGASSGLLGADDLDEAGGILEPGCSAAIIVYEDLWAGPLTAALRRSGARIVAGGLIPHETLIASLDATESADA
jgi:uncharacterized protein DUF6325